MYQEKVNFVVDKSKCIGCGKCLNVCPGNMVGGNVLNFKDGCPDMIDQTNVGTWKGCWKCQHCLAVCPTGAISIFGIKPEDVPEKPSEKIKEDLSKLIAYRRSCRSFLKKDVEKTIIDSILNSLNNMPTGGNNQSLEFSIVETRSAMKQIYHAVFRKSQISLFAEEETDDFSKLRLYDAPCLFIAHKAKDERFQDGPIVEINIATAYFELLANANDLGTVISTYAAEQLSKSKEARKLLRIPDNHEVMVVVGFGYPEIKYARGVKKDRSRKMHRIR